jgi:arylsulfatase
VYGIPWTGIENASAEMKALARPKMDRTKVPFDPPEYAEHLDQLPFDPDMDPAIGQ